jgi:hypothetical protein
MRAEISKALVVVTQHPAVPGASRWTLRILNLVATLAALGGVVYAFFGGWYWALIGIAAMLIIGRANRGRPQMSSRGWPAQTPPSRQR